MIRSWNGYKLTKIAIRNKRNRDMYVDKNKYDLKSREAVLEVIFCGGTKD